MPSGQIEDKHTQTTDSPIAGSKTGPRQLPPQGSDFPSSMSPDPHSASSRQCFRQWERPVPYGPLPSAKLAHLTECPDQCIHYTSRTVQTRCLIDYLRTSSPPRNTTLLLRHMFARALYEDLFQNIKVLPP